MADNKQAQSTHTDEDDLTADAVLKRTYWITVGGVVLFVAAALIFAIGADL